MILYEQGKRYWEVARRYHLHRTTSTTIKPTAVRDMRRLQQETHSQAVLRRINTFIAAHQTQPPPTGPRYA